MQLQPEVSTPLGYQSPIPSSGHGPTGTDALPDPTYAPRSWLAASSRPIPLATTYLLLDNTPTQGTFHRKTEISSVPLHHFPLLHFCTIECQNTYTQPNEAATAFHFLVHRKKYRKFCFFDPKSQNLSSKNIIY